jgi:hypothetical protein
MSTIKLKDILNHILTENTEEKEYLVTYYIIKNDDDIDYDEKVKATSKEEAIAKVKKDAPRLARAFSAELNETIEEDVRFNFQKGGGGGKRFIPTNGIVPSKLFTALPNHFKMLGDQLLLSPEAVIALTSVERGRGGAVNYKELYGKLRGYFDIKKADSSSEFGPAQTSSFLSQFKQGLKGRLEAVVVGGKEFKVWNGEGSKDEKGDFVFPLAQFKTDSLQENEEGLRSQLHTLVGNEMRLGKRANMTGASHHVEEHEKAEKAVEDFLRKNPSMEEYRDKIEDNFTKLLFK